MKLTALITGASRGIGQAIAIAFAKAGYRLVITCSKTEEELLALAEILTNHYGAEVLTSVGDIGDYHYVNQLFGDIEKRFGGVDVLVNNAGISYVGLLTDMSIDDWNRIVNTNLTSVFCTCKHAVPHMIQQQSGKIINISSVWGMVGASCETIYSIAKAGIDGMTKSLAKELGPSNIRVNSIAPGIINTDMNKNLSEQEINEILEQIPLEKIGETMDISKCVEWLIDDKYTTGQIISINGGWVII